MADTPRTPDTGTLTIPTGNSSPTGAVVLNPSLVSKDLAQMGGGK